MRQIALTLVCLLLAAPPLQAAEIPAPIAAAVAAPERSDKDRERDAREKPAELMAFTGVKPGMKVADVFGGGGYWTELFARAVGPSGSVTLVNNSPYWNLGKDDLETRFTDSRLKNARPRVVETRALDLGSGQYDLIVIFMSYHDLYWVEEEGGWPAIDADGFLKQLHAALKPGGRLLIVDHSAKAGSGKAPAQELHRIDEAFAKQDITSHGFELEKIWDGYRNPGDDLSKNVFDPAVRGKTDRFTQLYRRR
ncbi:MAG: methyltransferase domain-containing protein [Steroidobacteraceae bacterium]